MESGDGTTATTITLRDYWAVVQRRARFVIAGVLVGLTLAAGYLLVTPAEYSSASAVLVRSVRQEPFNPVGPGVDRELSMASERVVASSGVVATNAATLLGRPEAGREMLSQLTVELPTGTQVLRFVFHAESPAGAAAGANAFARAYLEEREARVLDEVQAVVQGIDDRVTGLETEQTEVQIAAAAATEPERQAALALQSSQLAAQLTDLRETRNALLTMDTTPGRVTQEAVPPRASIGPSRPLSLGAGLAGGLLVGLVIGLAREFTDDRVRDANDVVRRLGTPVLATLPARRRGERVTDVKPDSPAARTYAMLVVRAIQPDRWDRSHVLVITSAADGDGKSHVAANLAVAGALAHSRVLVVGTNGRNEVPTELAGRAKRRAVEPGGGVLAGTTRVTIGSLPEGSGVWYLQLGEGSWLDPRHVATVLAAARKEFDLVLVDVRSALTYPDTAIVAPSADAVLVVANAERTTRTDLEELAVVLAAARANVAGAVLNRSRSAWSRGSLRPSLRRAPRAESEPARGAVAARVPG